MTTPASDHHAHAAADRARSRLRHDRRSRDQQAPLRLSRRDLSFLLGRLPHQIRRRSRTTISTKDSRPKAAVPEGTIYTCPMHPEIRQVGPGSCPICGMALEPEVASLDAPPNPELADMTRRFWIGLVLALPAGRPGNGRPSRRRPRLGRSDAVELDPVRLRHARRAVGRLAVLRARLAVAASRAISTCSR